jgi:predicted ATPase/class 3 adenylate cyclase
MSSLPTGTVTFLFTDIEGSTRLVEQLGDAYSDVLADHCRIIRRAITDAGGTEVATEGDSFFAVFTDAGAAVAATAAAQRALAAHDWPAKADIRVRMGLHTGAAKLGGDNYVGLDVHRAARVAATGHGGQVVLSAPTRSLVAEALPAGVHLRDLGAHRLKDLAIPEHLYQLDVDGLPVEFPALRSLDARPNNLPLQLTSFVGREAELAAVGKLLDGARLVTLTGPGGTGKTRLALQVAAERLARYGDGVFFVELATVTDAQMVPTAVAGALRLREQADRPLIETLKDHFRDREVLLVLDNFEQVVGGAGAVTDLLAAAPRLNVLVTSRILLRVHGEHEFGVPPLAIPDAAHLPATEALSAYEGVALFIDRALAARPDFAITQANAPAVAEIIARLDGLPLAIELAAAKCRLLGPEAILGRLGSRLAFLGGGARDLPARQQTLREAIDWSYGLLSADEQAVMPLLGVFAGGFTLDAAGAVIGADATTRDTLDVLAGLVEQSLVRRDEGPAGEPRFAMLETIREYALERLVASNGQAAAQRRHAEYFLALAEALEPRLTGSPAAGEAVDRDHDNFRAALGWALDDGGESEIGLRLGFALWRFWQQRGHFREARAWFDRLLALPGADAPTPARARGLTGAGGIAYWQNDYPAALGWYTEAEAIIRTLDDPVWLADAMYNTGTTAALLGDLPTVTAKLEEGVAIGRRLGDDEILYRFLQAKGYMAFMGDDLEHARPLLEEALAVAERDSAGATDPTRPRTADRPAGELAIAHHTVAQVARLQGRLADAAGHYQIALRIGTQLGETAGVTEPFQGLAAIAIASGDAALVRRGVRWLGAYHALRERLGGGPPPEWLRLGDPLAAARTILPPAEYEAEWQAGLATSAADAFADAIATADLLARPAEVGAG